MRYRQAVLQQLLESGELGEESFRKAMADLLLARLREPMRRLSVSDVAED